VQKINFIESVIDQIHKESVFDFIQVGLRPEKDVFIEGFWDGFYVKPEFRAWFAQLEKDEEN